MTGPRTLTALAVAVMALLQGCYGAKMIKSPINSEHAAVQADSIRALQERILLKLSQLERELGEERDARVRQNAQMGVTLSELDESLRILTSRMDDTAQRRSLQSPPPRRTYTRPVPDTTSTPADSALAAADSAAAAGAAAEQELYRAAYLDLTRGNTRLAISGFQNYLVRFPAGSRLPEVHYYLGECYYAEDRFLEAVGEFQYVVREFPVSRLVPAAYLKSGYCYRELEERNLAERAFRSLIDEYPDTEEARQARQALEEFGG